MVFGSRHQLATFRRQSWASALDLLEGVRALVRGQDREQALQFEVMSQVSRITSTALELPVILQALSRELCRVVPFSRLNFAFYDAPTETIVQHHVAAGDWEIVRPPLVLAAKATSSWRAMQQRRTLLTPDVRHSPVPRHRELPAEGVLCTVSVPILREDACLGTLNLDADRPDAFSASQIAFLESVAAHLSVTVDNARLLAELRRELAERTRAEEALAHREVQLSEAQRLANLGSWELDLADGTVWWSDEAYRILGLTPGEQPASYEQFLERIHPDDVERVQRVADTGLSAGEPFEFEARILRADGMERFIHVRATQVADESGQRSCLMGTMQDLTVRKQAELAFQESERNLRALVGSLDDIVFEFDGEGTYVNAWTSDESLLAAPREALLGRRVTDVLGDDVGGVYLQIFRRVLQTGHSEMLEYSLDVEAGTRWFLASITPVRLPSGDSRTVSMLCRNITERKLAEAERERLLASEQAALAELRETQQQVIQQERLRALGQMASGIAHDFNNALAPIVAYCELLLAQPERLGDHKRVISFLEMMQTAAEDAAGVVRRLREFYRQRDSNEDVEPVHLDNLVAQVISLTQFRWKDQAQACGANITITSDVEGLPTVAGTPADLREALTNLIFNAVDALPNGGTIAISAELDVDMVVLSVRDTGVGMSEEVRLRCLEPFFTTKGEHGTGLGLGLVYGIVQRHQGILEVKSARGAGATVSMRLPIWSQPMPEVAASSASGVADSLSILVVEDEPRIRAALSEYLQIDEHVVVTAPNGHEGVEQFRAGRFDLVVTDRALPGMNGDQVAAAIKQLAPTVPIIMVTGFGDLMNQHHERPDGVDLIVGKPVTLAAMREAIRRVVRP